MSDVRQANPDCELVIQFAKWPEAGRVKTRLMPLLGAEGAMNAHLELTAQVLDNLVASGRQVQFWWDRERSDVPAEAAPILSKLQDYGVGQGVQQGADLGLRMTSALAEGLQRYARAMIVGSDCPSVDPAYVAAAFRALTDHDVVLGPSDDGGYVLIGVRRVVPGMLEGIAWGTPEVLERTCERLAGCGLSVHLLEPRWDVDEPGDWQRYLALLQSPA